MQIKLNYWKALLLLIPFIAGLALTNLVLTPGGLRYPWSIIANYLLVIGFLVIVGCQAYMLVNFINATKNDLYFKINALVPVAFLILNLVYMVYLNFKPYHPVNSSNGPVRVSNLNLGGLIILLLMMHAIINFFLTNNNYVSWQIKKITDAAKQEELRENYLKPMKILVRTSAYLFLIFVVITMFLDISQILNPDH